MTGRICFSAYLWSPVAALGKSAILFIMTIASVDRNNWALFSILPEKKNLHAWIYNRHYCLAVSISVSRFIYSRYILATCASYWPKDDKWKSDSVFLANLYFLDIDVILPSCPFLLLDMYQWEQKIISSDNSELFNQSNCKYAYLIYTYILYWFYFSGES